jgi:hypothetical protein
MGNPTCEKMKTLVSYLLVGMRMYTFCGFAEVAPMSVLEWGCSMVLSVMSIPLAIV